MRCLPNRELVLLVTSWLVFGGHGGSDVPSDSSLNLVLCRSQEEILRLAVALALDQQ